MNDLRRCWHVGSLAALAVLGGCTAISVSPSCPSELAVGESGTVQASPINAGAVPTYRWETIPAGAGTFGDDSLPTTTFVPSAAGEVTLRISASDSLYQAVAQCSINVTESGSIEVTLTIEPAPAIVDDDAILFCSSTGEVEAVVRTLEQTAGTPVTLSPLAEGVATFVPTVEGDLTFQCTGETASGRQSSPSIVTISVESDGGRRPPRG